MGVDSTTTADAVLPPPKARSSYGEALRSTAVIGGAALLNVAIGIVRTKVFAVLLGPAGFGLMGVYTSIVDLLRSAAGLGINSSGVRQIAAAAGSGDASRLGLTVVVLRRSSLALGLLGVVLMLVLSAPISTLTFGTADHVAALSMLSAVIFLRIVSDGQGALLQGMRRIADMARLNVLGAVGGTVLGLPLVFWLREDGVVPALIAVAVASLAVSWWYCRRIRIVLPSADTRQVLDELRPLLKLGAAFMASGLFTMAAAYGVRLLIIRHDGLEAAGHFQAAWTLGGLYVGFVLQAMGADFYPRLVAAAADDAECNRLVNEQARVSLLVGGSGIVATLVFAPWVITLFYSASFIGAVDALRWICVGMALRVISWPLGYIIIAKGRKTLFFVAELAWALVNVALTWAAVQRWGLAGAGIGFCGSYLFHVALVWAIGRRLSGFGWTRENRRTLLVFVGLIAVVQAGFGLLPQSSALALGVAALMASVGYSVRELRGLARVDGCIRAPAWWSRLNGRPRT